MVPGLLAEDVEQCPRRHRAQQDHKAQRGGLHPLRPDGGDGHADRGQHRADDLPGAHRGVHDEHIKDDPGHGDHRDDGPGEGSRGVDDAVALAEKIENGLEEGQQENIAQRLSLQGELHQGPGR